MLKKLSQLIKMEKRIIFYKNEQINIDENTNT